MCQSLQASATIIYKSARLQQVAHACSSSFVPYLDTSELGNLPGFIKRLIMFIDAQILKEASLLTMMLWASV